jgi:hypothetical protein
MTAQAVSLAAIESQSLALGHAGLRAGRQCWKGSADRERQSKRRQR